MKYKIVLIVLSLLFVIFSFSPQIWDILERPKIPNIRQPELVHNYLFDYNFYLSRIRQGIEGRWIVTEKYYNFPHTPSLFQIVYLYLGRIGGLFGMGVETIYHSARFVFGLSLLLLTSYIILRHFSRWWALASFLIITTSGSLPILIRLENGGWRSATYMGWWSAIDSLQRIAFIPHVLVGQIFLLLFIFRYAQPFYKRIHWTYWAFIGLLCGILFPPTLIVVYLYFVILSLFELAGERDKNWFTHFLYPRGIFILFTIPALLYLQITVKYVPWSALPLMDVMHRIGIPYPEYAKAIGFILPLGVIGMVLALIRQDRKMVPYISWVLTVGLLFLIFERVPTQSPLRFTEAMIHVPLGILTTYLFFQIAKIGTRFKRITMGVIAVQVIVGLFVMYSMMGWLTDQVYSKRIGTWSVPIGVQLIYPLKDFMAGIEYFRLHTQVDEVVLTYITAGNYIPAYAGNHVYIGHINTPDEDKKEGISAKFFSGKMKESEALELLQRERISYVYFGPQEKELAWIFDLETVYPHLPITRVYFNSRLIIYKVNKT